jgi:hypothetical protein
VDAAEGLGESEKKKINFAFEQVVVFMILEKHASVLLFNWQYFRHLPGQALVYISCPQTQGFTKSHYIKRRSDYIKLTKVHDVVLAKIVAGA